MADINFRYVVPKNCTRTMHSPGVGTPAPSKLEIISFTTGGAETSASIKYTMNSATYASIIGPSNNLARDADSTVTIAADKTLSVADVTASATYILEVWGN